jgi:hypothetical protein
VVSEDQNRPAVGGQRAASKHSHRAAGHDSGAPARGKSARR